MIAKLFSNPPPPPEVDDEEEEFPLGETIPPGIVEQLRQAEQKRRDKNGNPHGAWWESSDDYR